MKPNVKSKAIGLTAVTIAILAAVLLTSCAALLGSRQVELPLAELQAAMERKFPFNNRYLALFDISVTNPRLTLQPDTNRVITTMDASIAPPFLQRAWKGNLTVSGMLRLDPVRRAVVLGEPRVENFVVDGAESKYAPQIAKVGSLLVEQLLNDAPLYTFSEDQFRYSGARFLPSKITTKSSGLVVTFEPQ